MPVRVVVVVEETAAEQAAVFQTAKAAWEFRAILHRLELGVPSIYSSARTELD